MSPYKTIDRYAVNNLCRSPNKSARLQILSTTIIVNIYRSGWSKRKYTPWNSSLQTHAKLTQTEWNCELLLTCSWKKHQCFHGKIAGTWKYVWVSICDRHRNTPWGALWQTAVGRFHGLNTEIGLPYRLTIAAFKMHGRRNIQSEPIDKECNNINGAVYSQDSS